MCIRDRIKLAIWDTAGQEKFRTITRQFYRKVDGAILVYDLTDKKSLEDLESLWIPELNSNVTSDCQMLIVGNKCDLKEDPEYKDKIVTKEEAENVARKHATLFVESSAKSNEGVQQAFEELVTRLVEKPRTHEEDAAETVQIDPKNSPSQGWCCY